MTLLKVLHEYGHDNVHENELSHEYEDNEEYRCDDATNAAIFNAISGIVAVVPQGILHYAIPVVPGRDAE